MIEPRQTNINVQLFSYVLPFFFFFNTKHISVYLIIGQIQWLNIT